MVVIAKSMRNGLNDCDNRQDAENKPEKELKNEEEKAKPDAANAKTEEKP